MRNIIAVIIISLVSSNVLLGQSTPKQHELGIAFKGLNDLGITYKIGKAKALWRLNTLFATGNFSEDTADTTRITYRSAGIDIALGREWRSTLVDKLEVRYGFDIRFVYVHSERFRNTTGTFRDNETNSTSYSYGINLVFGANFIVSDNLFIGIEILPNFLIRTGKSTEWSIYTGKFQEHDLSGYSYGIDSTSALATIGFRF